jgi:hypothetical protein
VAGVAAGALLLGACSDSRPPVDGPPATGATPAVPPPVSEPQAPATAAAPAPTPTPQPTAAGTGTAAEPPIGSATMEPDGTIVLDLRARGPGMMGDAQMRYPKTHAEYANVLKHLGGLKPGENKPVPPFP